MAGRFPAIDVMRGLVMVLMTIDHASEAMNHGRVFTDSIFFYPVCRWYRGYKVANPSSRLARFV